MTVKSFPTGNSNTSVVFDDKWYVVDLGSGHNPHPRSDLLVDRFLLDDTERSGQALIRLSSTPFVIADGCAMPFKDKAFDFLVCSHVIEHIENVDDFCAELNRISNGGYLECPSRLSEIIRHAPNHRWFVSNRRGKLVIAPTPDGYPLGWLGRLFFSLYFYKTNQVVGRDVYGFAHGVRKPFHYLFILIRKLLVRLWIVFRPFTYTRLLWKGNFSWQVLKRNA